MINRNTFSFIISVLLTTGTTSAAEIYNKDSNKIDLYGKVLGLHYFSANKYADGDKSYGRMGLKGQTQINELVTGYGQWEQQFAFNKSENDNSPFGSMIRLGFAGLKFNQYGSIDFGRNYSVMYDALGWTDMLPEFSGPTANADRGIMGGRTTGVITYRNNDFFGLAEGWRFALQYEGRNERPRVDSTNGEGWGASASYTSPIGLAIVGAYTTNNRTLLQNDPDKTSGIFGHRAERWATGVKYDADNLYLAAIYSEGRFTSAKYEIKDGKKLTGFDKNSRTMELVAQYQFDSGLRPSLAYIETKAQRGDNSSYFNTVKYVDIGTTYYFNKNMAAYIDYAINMVHKNNEQLVPVDDRVAVGIFYQF